MKKHRRHLWAFPLLALATTAHAQSTTPSAAANERPIYQSNIANNVKVTLGPFENDPYRIQLKDLPPHAFVRIRANIIIAGDWGGPFQRARANNNLPDILAQDRLAIHLKEPSTKDSTLQDRLLLDASFSQWGQQSYPDNLGTAKNPAGTGGQPTIQRPGENKPDALYPMDFIIPHDKPELALEFKALLTPRENAVAGTKPQWSLDKLEISITDKPPTYTDAQLNEFLKQLAGNDSQQGAHAVLALAAMGDAALPTLEAALHGQGSDWEKMARACIDSLSDDNYDTREAAQKKLADMGPAVVPLCRDMLDKVPSEEARVRLTQILSKNPRFTVAQQRVGRAAAMIGGEKGQKLALTLGISNFKIPDIEEVRAALKCSPNEWTVFQPRIATLIEATNQLLQTPEGVEELRIRMELPAMHQLADLLNQPGIPDVNIKDAIIAVRKARPRPPTPNSPVSDLSLAQRNVQQISTIKQEAILMAMGLMW